MMYRISLHVMEKVDKFYEFKCVVFMNVSTGKTILMDGNETVFELWNQYNILKVKGTLV